MSVASRAALLVLTVLAVIVAQREERQRPLVACLVASIVYMLLNERLITPYLLSQPRPFHGFARVVLHTGQLLYLTPATLFGTLAWWTFRVPTRWLPLQSFLTFVTMVVLVDGYAHSPGPGLYKIGELTFRSATALLVWDAVSAFVFWLLLVPRVPDALENAHGIDASVTLWSFLAIGAATSVQVALPHVYKAPARDLGTALQLSGYVAAIALHLPAVFRALFASATPAAQQRYMISKRRSAMERLSPRLNDARAMLLAWSARGQDPDDVRRFPNVSTLARRTGRRAVLDSLAAREAEVVVATEMIAAATIAFRPRDRVAFVTNIRAVVLGAIGELSGDEVLDRDEMIASDAFEHLSILWQVPCLVMLASFHGLTVKEVKDAIGYVAAMLEP